MIRAIFIVVLAASTATACLGASDDSSSGVAAADAGAMQERSPLCQPRNPLTPYSCEERGGDRLAVSHYNAGQIASEECADYDSFYGNRTLRVGYYPSGNVSSVTDNESHVACWPSGAVATQKMPLCGEESCWSETGESVDCASIRDRLNEGFRAAVMTPASPPEAAWEAAAFGTHPDDNDCEASCIDPADGDPDKGAVAYLEMCADCHGGDGSGMPDVMRFDRQGTNLRDQLPRVSVDCLVSVIRRGRGVMNGVPGQRDIQKMTDLLAYFQRDFSAFASPGAPEPDAGLEPDYGF